eukprot:3849242-Amphidinium_carterae.1
MLQLCHSEVLQKETAGYELQWHLTRDEVPPNAPCSNFPSAGKHLKTLKWFAITKRVDKSSEYLYFNWSKIEHPLLSKFVPATQP